MNDHAEPDLPPGLSYHPDFIDRESEEQLIRYIDQQDWNTSLRRRTPYGQDIMVIAMTMLRRLPLDKRLLRSMDLWPLSLAIWLRCLILKAQGPNLSSVSSMNIWRVRGSQLILMLVLSDQSSFRFPFLPQRWWFSLVLASIQFGSFWNLVPCWLCQESLVLSGNMRFQLGSEWNTPTDRSIHSPIIIVGLVWPSEQWLRLMIRRWMIRWWMELRWFEHNQISFSLKEEETSIN